MMEFVPAEERTIGGRVVLSVNALDLYAFLGIRNPFMNWWPDQVRRANLVEGKDFSVLNLQGSGRNRTDVVLTTDAAEEIALQSDTEKGKEVRESFIKCKKELFARMRSETTAPMPVPGKLVDAPSKCPV